MSAILAVLKFRILGYYVLLNKSLLIVFQSSEFPPWNILFAVPKIAAVFRPPAVLAIVGIIVGTSSPAFVGFHPFVGVDLGVPASFCSQFFAASYTG